MNGKAELKLEQLRRCKQALIYLYGAEDVVGERSNRNWLMAAIAEAERVETAAERVARAAQDGFVWDADSPEEICYADEILADYDGEVVEVQLGLKLPGAFGFHDDKGDHWFNSREEAESALALAINTNDADAEAE